VSRSEKINCQALNLSDAKTAMIPQMASYYRR
jgi:hypothetical protein